MSTKSLDADAVQEYVAEMRDFCMNNFNTKDLNVCQTRMSQAYEEPWEQ